MAGLQCLPASSVNRSSSKSRRDGNPRTTGGMQSRRWTILQVGQAGGRALRLSRLPPEKPTKASPRMPQSHYWRRASKVKFHEPEFVARRYALARKRPEGERASMSVEAVSDTASCEPNLQNDQIAVAGRAETLRQLK